MIDLFDEPEQRLVFVVEPRRFKILEHGRNQIAILQEFCRNCGMSLDSKRAVIARGSEGGDQFAYPRAQW